MRSVLLVFSFIFTCVVVSWSACQEYNDVDVAGFICPNNNTSSWSCEIRRDGELGGGYYCGYNGNLVRKKGCSNYFVNKGLSPMSGDCPGIWTVKGNYACCSDSLDVDCEARKAECQLQGGVWVDSSGYGDCDGYCKALCNDHTNEQTKCTETWNPGYSYDADGNPGGGGYWQITTFDCYYDSCAMSLNCTEKSKFPAGSLTCDDFESPNDTLQCIAAIGANCTIQCPGGTTINCKCDGSCLVAQTRKDCQCPQQSSSSSPPQSSSSSPDENSSSSDDQNLSSSNNQENSSSSLEVPRSSSSPRDTSSNGDWEYDYSQVLNEIEFNTRRTASNTSQIASNTNEIATNTNVSAGYLSSIDKWQSTINFNLQAESGKIQSAIESGAAQAADATKALGDSIGHLGDSLGRTNSLLDDIKGTLSDSVPDVDISGWQDSANAIISKLENPETTLVRVDSLENDTSRFKSSYSRFFLSGAYSRDGCYEFKMAKPAQDSKFGRFFKNDIVVDFGNLAGTFDFCAIFRGICRIAGALLVILISIKSYRSAFSSEDG